jgi:hypothetical protein
MNRVQKRQLHAFLHFRHRTMSVPALVAFNWRIFLLLFVAGGATVGACLYYGMEAQAGLFAVAYGALVLRDLAHLRRASRVWPMTREILDWSKVERMAAEIGIVD